MPDGKTPADVAAFATPVFFDCTDPSADTDPMTDLQIAELRTLADRLGEPFAATLTRREAQDRIVRLRDRL
ncbi:DUF3072 domain-containing protein [Psychromarinibacter sp. S121]|uniref:DUF3072 domain-containing protein n=1 Tax=Psychromarinibacter sp. S121 TaxID=3415127 RepID=UPI003C7A87AC